MPFGKCAGLRPAQSKYPFLLGVRVADGCCAVQHLLSDAGVSVIPSFPLLLSPVRLENFPVIIPGFLQ